MDNKELLDAIRSIVKEEVDPIKEDIKTIKSTQEEHTQILRALEDRTKVTQAEVENIKYDLAEIKGSIKELTNKQDLLEDVTANNWTEIISMKKKQA